MARDCCAGPEWRSMMTGFTPRRASWLASIRPVGPAPTIRTSTSTFVFRCDRSVMAVILMVPGKSVGLWRYLASKVHCRKDGHSSDQRRREALGGDQLADPLARIEHPGLHRVQRHAEDRGRLLDLLAVVVDEIDDLAMHG